MKRLCLCMAVIIALSIVPGCGQGAGGQSNSVEITVVTPFNSQDGNHDNFVNAYKAYEIASGHTVKDGSDFTTNEGWKLNIIDDFQNGNEPDILFYFTGPDADKLVQNDKLVSIGEIRKEYADYASNMKDAMMPVSTADGRQYAVPVNGYWEGLFVNKKVLADCGVPLPGADYSWEQFILDCRTIKEQGYTPIACSLMEIPHYWFEFCTFNNGSIATHASLPASSGDAIGRVWAAGLMDIKQLYNQGFFPENTNTATDGEINLLMTDNKAAFMLDGSWKVGWFQANAANIDDFAVTYVPAKGERKPTDIIGGLSMGYYITKKAWDDPQKRRACVDFVNAMTTDEVVSSFGALSVTALKNGTTPTGDVDALFLSALAMTKGCTGIVSAAQDMLITPARNALFENIQNIVSGTVTPEQAIDDCLAINE